MTPEGRWPPPGIPDGPTRVGATPGGEMRRWSVIVAGVVGIGVLLIGFVLAIPALFGGRIEQAVRDEANEALVADVEIGDIGLSLLSQFPLLQVRVEDVVVSGRDRYEGVPLLAFESLSLGVDLWSVVSGSAIEVRRVDWVNPAIDIRIEEDGSSNLDIFPPSDEPVEEEEEAGEFEVVLEALTVSGLDLTYTDHSLGLSAALEGLSTELTGRFDEEIATVAAQIRAEALDLEEAGVALVRDAGLEATVDLDYALDTGAITLRDNAVRINALELAFAGSVVPAGDDTDLDLTFTSPQTSFKALLSMVPAAYIEGYEDVEADGTFTLNGNVKGRLPAEGEDLPGFEMRIGVADGSVQYPELPSSVDGIAVDMAITHPQGPVDATVVDVPRFAFSVANAPMEGSLRLEHPTTDPKVAMQAEGMLDFAKLAAAMPGEGLPSEGRVELDVDIAGRSSDFEAQNVDAVRASGTVGARDVMIVDTGYATPVRVQRMDLSFTSTVVELSQLTATWLGSDLKATGSLDGFVPYMLGKRPLAGRVELTSEVLDLRPFQGESTDEDDADDTAGDSGGVVVVVPEDVALSMRGRFDKVVLTEFTMTDMVGRLSVADQSMVIDELSASMLGGRVEITGRYTAKTPDRADIDFRIATVDFDLARTVAEFATLGRIAPLLKGVNGTFDSDFQLSTGLDREGNLDLSGLASRGSLLARGLTLTPTTLNAAANKLKRPQLDALELAERQLRFVIEEGKLSFEPFEAKLGGLPATVTGGAGIVDRTLDFAIDLGVPARLLAGSDLLSGLTGGAENVDVRLGIGGSYDEPRVDVKLKDGRSVGEAVVEEGLERLGLDKDARIAEARARGDALVAEAESQADKLRAEAKEQADKLRREGRQQANKLIREAGNNPIKKAAATKAADVAKNQADKAADKIEREADQRADRLVTEAKERREKLVSEAGG